MRRGFNQFILIAISILCLVAITMTTFVMAHSTAQVDNEPNQGLPQRVRPFSKFDLRINYIPDRYGSNKYDPDGFFSAQNFQSLSEVSTNDFQTLSSSAPLSNSDPDFAPFGHHIRLSFSVPRIEIGNYNDNDDDFQTKDEIENDEYLFVLRLDEIAVQLTGDNITKTKIFDENGNETIQYPARVSYTGEQLNADGTLDKVVLSILPNYVDSDHLYDDNEQNNDHKDRLETQSIEADRIEAPSQENETKKFKQNLYKSRRTRPESMSTLSGRQDNGYTIEGLIITGNGRLIQIAPYSFLLLQQQELKITLEESLESQGLELLSIDHSDFNTQSTLRNGMMKIQAKIDKLSDLMSTLYDQQSEAVYDLSYSEVTLPPINCRVGRDFRHYDDHADHHNDENHDNENNHINENSQESRQQSVVEEALDHLLNPLSGKHQNYYTTNDNRSKNGDDNNDNNDYSSPLNMSSQWALTRWSSCHNNQNTKQTIFPIKFVLADNYRRWASNVRWDEPNASTKVLPALVSARLQYTMTIMNLIFSQQMEISWSIHSTVDAPSGVSWNYQSKICPNIGLDQNDDLTNFNTWVSAAGSGRREGALVYLLWHCSELNTNGNPSSKGGTSGRAYLGTTCKTAFNIGVSAFTWGTVVSWQTLAHEIGHNLGLAHSEDATPPHTYGIMSYSSGRVPADMAGYTGDALRLAFYAPTDKPVACATINNIITGTTTPLVPGCMVDPTANSVAANKLSTPNGYLEPYEQCDIQGKTRQIPITSPSTCCNSANGRFTRQDATCGFHNECCSSDCKVVSAATTCSLRSDDPSKTQPGYCSNGECLPACVGTSEAESSTCNELVGTWNPGSCRFTCRETGTGCTSTGSWGQDMEIGTICGDNMFCVPNQPTSTASNELTCRAIVSTDYTWDVNVVRVCTTLVDQIDSYICRGPAGTVVGDSYCPATRPAPSGPTTCNARGTITVTSTTPSTTTREAGSSVTVNWSHTGSNYYNQVNVQMVTGTTVTTIASNIDIHLGTYTFSIPTTGLTPGSSYVIRVRRSVNAGGQPYGDSSAFSLGQPAFAPAFSNISGLTAGISQSVTITVNGNTGASQPITPFRYVNTASPTTTITLNPTVSPPTTSFTVGIQYTLTFTLPADTITTTTAHLEMVSGGVTYSSNDFTLTTFTWGTTWSPTTCPTNRCSTSQRTPSAVCNQNRGTQVTSAPTSNCSTTTAPTLPSAQTCQASFSCGSFGTCSTAGTQCNCQNGYTTSGTSQCSVPPSITNVAVIKLENNDNLSETDVNTSVRVRFTYSGAATTLEYLLLINDSIVQTATSLSTTASPFTFTLGSNAVRSSNARIRIRIQGIPTILANSANIFSIYSYSWGPGPIVPATCPTNNCQTITRTQPYVCNRSNGATSTVVTSGCTGQAPATTTAQPCDPAVTCKNSSTCTNQVCQCTGIWRGVDCSLSTTLSNVALTSTSSSSQINIGTTTLTLTWSSDGDSVPVELIYRETNSSTNFVTITTTTPASLQSDAGSATFIIPFGTAPSSTGIISIRLKGTTSGNDASPIIDTVGHSWQLTDWTSCQNASCSSSNQQHRFAKCISSNNNNNISSLDLCDPSNRPNDLVQTCNPDVTCQNGGVCNEKTNSCDCSEGFFGQDCSGSTNCSVETPSSTDVSTPTADSYKCLNGGFIMTTGSEEQCGETCQCTGGWDNQQVPPTATNPGCSECSLQCSTSSLLSSSTSMTSTGQYDKECSSCQCNKGYFGPECGCREFYITLSFSTFPENIFISKNFQNSRSHYDKTLSLENSQQFLQQINILSQFQGWIGSNLNQPDGSVDVTWWYLDAKNVLHITASIKGDCSSSPMMLSTGEGETLSSFSRSSSKFKPRSLTPTNNTPSTFTSLADESTYKSLDDWFNTISTPSSSSSSSFSTGFTHQTPVEISKNVYDPSCISSDFPSGSKYSCNMSAKQSPFTLDGSGNGPNDDDSGLSTTTIIIIAVVVGGGVLLLIIIIILICCCCGCGDNGRSSSSSNKKNDKNGVQMQEQQPYTQNPMTMAPAAPVAPTSPQAPRSPMMAPGSPQAPRPPMAPQAPRY